MNEKLKMVIAYEKQEESRALFEFARSYGYTIVGHTSRGDECCELITENYPDVVISDVCLEDMDICGITDMLRLRGYDGETVLAVAASSSQGCVIEQALGRGVDIFTLIPFDGEYIDARIRRAVEKKRGDDSKDRFDLLDYVSRLMHEVGVPASIRGYDYIRDSIMLALSDKDILRSITKELYPSIAKTYATTPSRVERAIRHAVEVAWSRGDVDVLNGIFGYTVKSSKGKPTNGEFISMLTERVRLDLRVG